VVGGQLQIELCDAAARAPGAPAPPPGQVVAEIATDASGTETLQLAHEGFIFDIPIDPDSWVVASGSVDLGAGTGSIAQAATRDEISAMTAARFAITVDGYELGPAGNPMFADVAGLALRLTAADGSALAVVPVTTDAAGHGNGTDHGSIVGFFSPVPWVDGAVSLDLLVDGAVVDSRPISPTAPAVGAVQVETVGGARTVSWEVEDPDADSSEGMSFTVLWSADGGETWLPAADGVSDTELTIPESAPLPGGDDVLVQVIANDGVRTGQATSATFAAPGHAPTVVIAGAPAGPIEEGELVELTAVIADPEATGRGLDIAAIDGIAWGGLSMSSVDGPLLRTRDLPLGNNTIEVVVTDSAGNEATAEVVIEVVERTSPSRDAEPVEPRANDYFNAFQCIPDSASQAVAGSCAEATTESR
jgi:hypothetical protein